MENRHQWSITIVSNVINTRNGVMQSTLGSTVRCHLAVYYSSPAYAIDFTSCTAISSKDFFLLSRQNTARIYQLEKQVTLIPDSKDVLAVYLVEDHPLLFVACN